MLTLSALAGRTIMLNPRPATFEEKFANLCRFVAAFGHACPSKRYVTDEGYQLGRWVFHLRDLDRRHYLSQKQDEMLEALPGWTWAVATSLPEPREDEWREVKAPLSARDGKAPAWHAPQLEHLRGRNVLLVDMDATVYDPWSCQECGFKERSLRASKNKAGELCLHLRHDTLAQVTKLAKDQDALIVVCSYRSGRLGDTRAWIEEDVAMQDFRPAAYLIPGAPDDCSFQSGLLVSSLLKAGGKDWGQVSFKARTADALQKRWGAIIVGAFDDNETVCEAYQKLGAKNVMRVRYLVKIEPWEWMAGRLGVPKPAPLAAHEPLGPLRSQQRSLWEKEPEKAKGPRRRQLQRRNGGYGHYSSLGSYSSYDPDETYGADSDDFDDDAPKTSFKLGDPVRFVYASRSSLGEVVGEEDGYVVVVDEQNYVVYLRPEEATRI
jgi:hypothetical protein